MRRSPQKLLHEFGWTPEHSSLENMLAGAWNWEQHQCKRLIVEDVRSSAIS
jgi:UDP-glucose 4-epimerase